MNIPHSGQPEAMTMVQNLQDNGYHILADTLSEKIISKIIDDLKKQTVRRTPLNERNQSQWWDEISCSADSLAARLMFGERVSELISANWGEISYCTYWANLYQTGEFIPRHRDSEGHIQIITGLIASPESDGGFLVIHHNEAHQFVLQPGQQLLFKANETFHETTPLISSSDEPNPIRCVGICRVFLKK